MVSEISSRISTSSECPVCFDNTFLLSLHKIHSVFHRTCSSCAEEIIIRGNKACPICREGLGKTSDGMDSEILEIIRSYEVGVDEDYRQFSQWLSKQIHWGETGTALAYEWEQHTQIAQIALQKAIEHEQVRELIFALEGITRSKKLIHPDVIKLFLKSDAIQTYRREGSANPVFRPAFQRCLKLTEFVSDSNFHLIWIPQLIFDLLTNQKYSLVSSVLEHYASRYRNDEESFAKILRLSIDLLAKHYEQDSEDQLPELDYFLNVLHNFEHLESIHLLGNVFSWCQSTTITKRMLQHTKISQWETAQASTEMFRIKPLALNTFLVAQAILSEVSKKKTKIVDTIFRHASDKQLKEILCDLIQIFPRNKEQDAFQFLLNLLKKHPKLLRKNILPRASLLKDRFNKTAYRKFLEQNVQEQPVMEPSCLTICTMQ